MSVNHGAVLIPAIEAREFVSRKESWARLVFLCQQAPHSHKQDVEYKSSCLACAMHQVIKECEPTSEVREAMIAIGEKLVGMADHVHGGELSPMIKESLLPLMRSFLRMLEQPSAEQPQTADAEPGRGVAKPS
jgi:hypothetical protein